MKRLWPALLVLTFMISSLAAFSGRTAADTIHSGTVQVGQTVSYTLANGHHVEVTATSSAAGNAPKGGAMATTINSSWAEITYVEYFGCYCVEAWRYTLHTDFQWDGTYLYSDSERDTLQISAAGYVNTSRYVGHFTLQSDPNNGWAMINRSYGHVEMQEWDGPILIATCVVNVYNNVNGNGSSASSWDSNSC